MNTKFLSTSFVFHYSLFFTKWTLSSSVPLLCFLTISILLNEHLSPQYLFCVSSQSLFYKMNTKFLSTSLCFLTVSVLLNEHKVVSTSFVFPYDLYFIKWTLSPQYLFCVSLQSLFYKMNTKFLSTFFVFPCGLYFTKWTLMNISPQYLTRIISISTLWPLGNVVVILKE